MCISSLDASSWAGDYGNSEFAGDIREFAEFVYRTVIYSDLLKVVCRELGER